MNVDDEKIAYNRVQALREDATMYLRVDENGTTTRRELCDRSREFGKVTSPTRIDLTGRRERTVMMTVKKGSTKGGQEEREGKNRSKSRRP